MPTLTAAVLQALLQTAAGATSPGTTLVAIALAESGGELDAVVTDTDATGAPRTRRGPWMIADGYGYNRERMTLDAAYAAACAWEIYRRDGYAAWATYRTGAYLSHVMAARQGAALAAAVSGTILDGQGAYVPSAASGAVARPPVTPVLAGAGTPLVSAVEHAGPLVGLRIIGTEVTGDFGSSIIGAVTYEAGWDTIPNLSFTIADPEGDLLWMQRNLWVKGARVEYLDLDMRISELEFAPGGHTTGQLSINAVDAVVYALQHLRGARTATCSVATWLRQELQLCGYDPNRYLCAENGPSREIARDVPDPNANSGSSDDPPSGWTTAARLAKEEGKRIFMSGRKLIYGSVEFAMQWAAAGDLKIGYHNMAPGERWLNLPTGKAVSVGSRDNVAEVSGSIPFNRARFFRPGVSVIVTRTPAVAASDRTMMCTNISHELGNDVSGADITLIEPVNLTPEKKETA